MLTNPRSDRVRQVRALHKRPVRQRTGRFCVEGPQGVREAVRHAPGRVRDVYVTPQAAERYAEDILAPARAADLWVHEVSGEVLAAMAEAQAPQGVLAVVEDAPVTLAQVLEAGPRLLVLLSSVRDPGNAGTVVRGADAAGADAVLVSEASVDVHSPKVVRSTAGSLFHLPVVTGLEVAGTIEALRARGVRCYAADGAGSTLLPEADLGPPHCWVMGNEARGLPAPTRAACDDVVRVPVYGRAESLNLAMAATVCLYASATAQRPAAR
ncbi:RNA methyltransferase [Phycicoccus endophyticus]|uniref:RNA methyltransferase n=1 Tax=Phycicoccus endophyticus TaxID=1690220 RepID=A0A7G9R436_9MICO|nr:RNA methyltransferase [Phycicoccus endophyticus]NHI18204.1 RNA methyltransferase [Phycicoccus endophyticus]QNN50361.1 RNA methyltransferase [Phycicoccus endophyticus]GGL25661.1 RNA methyltransferase [Phycicoccus endophyticus]